MDHDSALFFVAKEYPRRAAYSTSKKGPDYLLHIVKKPGTVSINRRIQWFDTFGNEVFPLRIMALQPLLVGTAAFRQQCRGIVWARHEKCI